MSRRLVMSDLSYGALCLLVSINSIYGTISLKEDAVGAIINRRVEKIVGFIAKPCADGTASAIDRDRQDRKNISSCEAQPLPADAHLFRNEEELASYCTTYGPAYYGIYRSLQLNSFYHQSSLINDRCNLMSTQRGVPVRGTHPLTVALPRAIILQYCLLSC